jgi:hypothetical protein
MRQTTAPTGGFIVNIISYSEAVPFLFALAVYLFIYTKKGTVRARHGIRR